MMELTDKKRRVKTIIIPQGAFDANDTIVLKVPKSPPSYPERRVRSSCRPQTPAQIQEHLPHSDLWYGEPALPPSIIQRLEKSYYKGFLEGHRIVNSRPEIYKDEPPYLQGSPLPEPKFIEPEGPVHSEMREKIHSQRKKTDSALYHASFSEKLHPPPHTAYSEISEIQRKDHPFPTYPPIPTDSAYDPRVAEEYKHTLLRHSNYSKSHNMGPENFAYAGYPDGPMGENYEDTFFADDQDTWQDGER